MEGEFRLTDFMKPDRIRLTGVFFSILSNLNKFTAFEQRDPFVVKQQQEPGFTYECSSSSRNKNVTTTLTSALSPPRFAVLGIAMHRLSMPGWPWRKMLMTKKRCSWTHFKAVQTSWARGGMTTAVP